MILVATGEASKAYSVTGVRGYRTYYILGILYKNRWLANPGSPEAGDKLGEYSDGLWGTPQPVTVEASDQTGKNFELKLTN